MSVKNREIRVRIDVNKLRFFSIQHIEYVNISGVKQLVLLECKLKRLLGIWRIFPAYNRCRL